MGGGQSNQAQPVSMQNQLMNQQKNQKRSARFPPFSEVEVASLMKKFTALDEFIIQLYQRNEKGQINIEEFKNLLEIRMHFFRDRFFELLKVDMENRQTSLLSFDQFLMAITVFHPLTTRNEKVKYMFKLYDMDGDGQVSREDMMGILDSVFVKSALTFQPPSRKPKINMPSSIISPDTLKRTGKESMIALDKSKSGFMDFDRFNDNISDFDLQLRMNIVF